MNRETEEIVLFFLFIILAILCLFVFRQFLSYISTTENEANDKECQRLGFEKYTEYKLNKYCIKGGQAVEVQGNCGISDCDLWLK